jgi:hypothetical protein
MRRNRQGWHGESRRHYLAARGIKTTPRTPTIDIDNVTYTPDIIGYYVIHPTSKSIITYLDAEELKNNPAYAEKVEAALSPEHYKWKPVKKETE